MCNRSGDTAARKNYPRDNLFFLRDNFNYPRDSFKPLSRRTFLKDFSRYEKRLHYACLPLHRQSDREAWVSGRNRHTANVMKASTFFSRCIHVVDFNHSYMPKFSEVVKF